MSLGYNRSPGRPAALAVADFLWDLPTGGGGGFTGAEELLICCRVCSRSPERPSDCWVFRETVKLFSCVKLFSRGWSMDCGFCFCVQSYSREAFGAVALHATEPLRGLQTVVPSCPVNRETPGMPSSCGVLGAMDLLRCLRVWYQTF